MIGIQSSLFFTAISISINNNLFLQTEQLIHRKSGLCIDRHATTRDIIIDTCDSYRNNQKWTFQYTYSDRPL